MLKAVSSDASIEGTTQSAATSGVFLFENLILIAPPGKSGIVFSATTNSIDNSILREALQ